MLLSLYGGARSGGNSARGGQDVEVKDDREGGLILLHPLGGGPGVEHGVLVTHNAPS